MLLTCCFPLAAFHILSFCLVFVSLISVCLGLFHLEFFLYGTLCASWTWLSSSFSMLGKFSTIISSKIFSYPFFYSSSSGTPIIRILVHLMWSQRSLRLSSALFILFTLFCSSQVTSTILFQLADSLFCFTYSAVYRYQCLFWVFVSTLAWDGRHLFSGYMGNTTLRY